MIWSEVGESELLRAPRHVRDVMLQIPPEYVTRIETSDEAKRLADIYLAEGIVGPAQRNDALHVANAVVVEADCLASWNHRHLANLDKMRRFNAVNLSEGYRTIDIRSPVELYSHD